MAVISSNAYLTVAQMTGNAQYILNYLMARGWTKEVSMCDAWKYAIGVHN